MSDIAAIPAAETANIEIRKNLETRKGKEMNPPRPRTLEV
jgi:hypothetical protein